MTQTENNRHMENAPPKATKMKSFFKNLPKVAQAAAVSFQNLPFSPRHLHHHHHAGFSGPLIPAEARRRPKSSETDPEPGSPKVSCIGQIKCRPRTKPRKDPGKDKNNMPAGGGLDSKEKPRPSRIMRLFSAQRKSDASVEHIAPPISSGSPPRLGQMRKYASSRDTLAGFDWTAAQVAPEHRSDGELSSDEERGYDDGGDSDVIIPFSAPILGAGSGLVLEPRKEINLWKRRTMTRPNPLQLNAEKKIINVFK